MIELLTLSIFMGISGVLTGYFIYKVSKIGNSPQYRYETDSNGNEYPIEVNS